MRMVLTWTVTEIVSEIATIAVLHHQIDVLRCFLAVQQRHHILMVQLSQLLENFNLFLQ